jgi:dTDP-4-dehydrorhamnose 3,5-epimerase
MTFHEIKLPGVFEVRLEPNSDERGFFARAWCQREFEAHGLDTCVVQCNISFNTRRGTLRGIHYQAAPHAESKLVRCTRGAVYDVVVDLRSNSPTYRDWMAVVLTAEMRNLVYVPRGCGHGFLTLEDDAEVFYQMSQFYNAESARGVRWDDPAFQIVWPEKVAMISERDRTYPDFESLKWVPQKKSWVDSGSGSLPSE